MHKYVVTTLAVFALLTHAARGQETDTLVHVGGDRLQFHIVRGRGLPILFDAG